MINLFMNASRGLCLSKFEEAYIVCAGLGRVMSGCGDFSDQVCAMAKVRNEVMSGPRRNDIVGIARARIMVRFLAGQDGNPGLNFLQWRTACEIV
jgi:hypothetical protein